MLELTAASLVEEYVESQSKCEQQEEDSSAGTPEGRSAVLTSQDCQAEHIRLSLQDSRTFQSRSRQNVLGLQLSTLADSADRGAVAPWYRDRAWPL